MLLGQTTFEIVAVSVGIGTAILTTLGTAGGFIWWFAKLHSAVAHTGKAVTSVSCDVKEVKADVKALTFSVALESSERQKHALTCDAEREAICERVGKLETVKHGRA